ncbi:MAG TPA: hypothetical protein VI636_20995, partial [Candidatus Angelobacter sp.]
EKGSIFDSKAISVFRGYAKEMQSLLNSELLETLSDVEENQAFEWGKVRIAREHYLNPERPAFGQGKRKRKR